jgi:hypothetical protein
MDLQVDLRWTLDDGQPEPKSEPEQGQEVDPVSVYSPPLIYPEDVPLSRHDLQSADEVLDFGEIFRRFHPMTTIFFLIITTLPTS